MSNPVSAIRFYARLENSRDAIPFWVSPIDAWWVRLYEWKANREGYIYRPTSYRRGDGTWRAGNKYLHREILGLEYRNPLQGDHLNNDPTNNTRPNLRIVTKEQNLERRYEKNV